MTTGPPIRLLVADDDDAVREALRDLLERVPDFIVVGTACDTDEAIAVAQRTQPDVVILDMKMPGGGGIRAAREIADCAPNTHVLGLSAFDDTSMALELRRAGGVRYLVKGAPGDEIIAAVRQTFGGGPDREVAAIPEASGR